MAGTRLENWSTLDREDLRERVVTEAGRTDLTFPETQLLEAAQNRLRNWREPFTRRRAMVDDIETLPDSIPEATEEKAPKVKKVAKKRIKVEAAANAAEDDTADTAADTAAVIEGEPEVKKASKTKKAAPAKKASAKKKTAKKATAAKKTKATANGTGNGAVRANMTDIVRWKKSAENPFREGSGSYKRTELVRENSGKTRKEIQGKAVKASTIATLARLGLVEIDAG